MDTAKLAAVVLESWHADVPSQPRTLARQAAQSRAGLFRLYELFGGAEAWHTERLLERAATGREILERIVIARAVWTAALTNENNDSVPGLTSSEPASTPATLS